MCKSAADESLEFMHSGRRSGKHTDCAAALYILQQPDIDAEGICSRKEVYAPKLEQNCYAGSNLVVGPDEVEGGTVVQGTIESSDKV